MERSESVLVGKVIEMRKITQEFENLETGNGVEVRQEGYIKCEKYERWVKFDPRKVATVVTVGDEVIFELSDRSSDGYPRAYRVRLEKVEKGAKRYAVNR